MCRKHGYLGSQVLRRVYWKRFRVLGLVFHQLVHPVHEVELFEILLAAALRIIDFTGILTQELGSVLKRLDPPNNPAKDRVFSGELGRAGSQLGNPPFDKVEILR